MRDNNCSFVGPAEEQATLSLPGLRQRKAGKNTLFPCLHSLPQAQGQCHEIFDTRFIQKKTLPRPHKNRKNGFAKILVFAKIFAKKPVSTNPFLICSCGALVGYFEQKYTTNFFIEPICRPLINRLK